MDYWTIYILSLLAAGLASGFVAGLFGVGGGIIRIPIFLFLFPILGIHADVLMHVAAGTSLSLSIPSAIMASREQYKAGKLDLNFLKVWAPGLIVGVLIGIFLMRFISSGVLEQIFAFVIFVISVQMFFTTSEFKLTKEFPGAIVKALIAIIIGVLSKLTGLSGGSFTTPTLTAFGYPIHRSIAIATAGGFFISIFGALGSAINGMGISGRPAFSLGYIDLTAVLVMIPAILLMAPLGVKLAVHTSQDRLRKVFSIFLFIVALDMIRTIYF